MIKEVERRTSNDKTSGLDSFIELFEKYIQSSPKLREERKKNNPAGADLQSVPM